ncbi:Heparinase II/III-like protein [Opitutaceae bacterium TAV1]|nr:Heparinase II/III-like protein [Opitutaceae bacterium TAV1]
MRLIASLLPAAASVAAALPLCAKSLPAPDPGRQAAIAGWIGERNATANAIAFYSPPFADRTFWDRATRALQPLDAITDEANRELTHPPPALPPSLYYHYKKTGERWSYEKPFSQRTRRLGVFLFAEGLFPSAAPLPLPSASRYLPAIEREIAAILDEPSWAVPAHTAHRKDWADSRDFIDLAATARAWDLALADYLLGNRLAPATRVRIRAETRSRIFTPYLERIRSGDPRDFWWMNGDNNWNAVCNAGVLGAALLLSDDATDASGKPFPGGTTRQERAGIIAAFEALTPFFIAGFGDDGFCHEGLAYWNYGYGHYTLGAELVRLATGGRIDLLAGEKQKRIATFDVRWQLADGLYPTFGDAWSDARPSGWLHDFATLRYGGSGGLTGLPAAGKLLPHHGLGSFLFVAPFDLALPRPTPDGTEASAITQNSLCPPLRDWFPDGGALIVRSASGADAAGSNPHLAAALKGGHNGQPHNHNDLGSFIVSVDGEVVLADPGADDYVKDTFSSRRYTSGVMNSFGHPVPRVAGKLQRAGRAARADTLRTEFTAARDLWEIDLTSAYVADVPALESLIRTFIFTRSDADSPGGRLDVIDRVKFRAGQPQTFGSALILLPRQQREQITENGFRVRNPGGPAVDVTWTAESRTTSLPFPAHAKTALEVSTEPVTGIVPGKPPKGNRIGLDFPSPVEEARIRITVTPVK